MQENNDFDNDLKKTQLAIIIRQSFLEMDAPFDTKKLLEYITGKNPGVDIIEDDIISALKIYCTSGECEVLDSTQDSKQYKKLI